MKIGRTNTNYEQHDPDDMDASIEAPSIWTKKVNQHWWQGEEEDVAHLDCRRHENNTLLIRLIK